MKKSLFIKRKQQLRKMEENRPLGLSVYPVGDDMHSVTLAVPSCGRFPPLYLLKAAMM